MIDISTQVSDRLIVLFEEINDIIPDEIRPLVEQLKTQITQLKCEDGLLTEVIVLLQEYYKPHNGNVSFAKNDNKKEKADLNDKIGNLIIALHQIRNQETQILNMKVRR